MSVWMAYAILIAGIACVAATIVEHLLWIWRAPRRIAWLAALIVGILAPVLIPLWYGASSRPSAIAPPSVITPAPPSLTRPRLDGMSPMHSSASAERPRFAASFAARSARLVESALPTLWLGTSGLLLCWVLLSYARLERQSAMWHEMNLDGTTVVLSPNCGPAVFGIVRPRIVIPRWALSLDAQDRSLLLCHEREHLRARDAQCLLVSIVAALVFPWNVALWLVVRRLRLAIELDCDDRVLRGRTDARTYGSLLLAVSARRNREMTFAVGLIERSSMLERRIKAMTAVTPRRRSLISIPLLAGVVVLSAAAVRTPSPQPFSMGHGSSLAVERRTVTSSLPTRTPTQGETLNALDSLLRSADSQRSTLGRMIPDTGLYGSIIHMSRGADSLMRMIPSRLAAPESLPLISVTWENAPIENVIAAFAAFSHRRITMAPSVGGLVTATVVDQPWARALVSIMSRQGLRVEFMADSSIYIAPLADAPPRQSGQAVQVGRAVSGTVADASTGAPIRNARINVAGVQLIGAPNEAWSDEQGRFALRAPDGEVWLDACAPGYDFRRVTLASGDSVADFRGDRNGERLASDTVRIDRKEIENIELIKAPRVAGLPSLDDAIQVTTKDGKTTRIPIQPEAAAPVLVIDGVVVNGLGAPTRGCMVQGVATFRFGGRIQFRVF